jgi:hypothetical protein
MARLPRPGGKVFSKAHRTSVGVSSEAQHPREISGAQAPRRYRFKPKDTIPGISAPDIRRLARRGGVKRISKEIYDEARLVMRQFLSDVHRLLGAADSRYCEIAACS